MNMRYLTQRLWLVAGLLAVTPAVFAQQTSPPAAPAPAPRQAPPPEDLEPGVNTSAMPANTPPAPAPGATTARPSKPADGSKSAAGSRSAASKSAGSASAAPSAPAASGSGSATEPAGSAASALGDSNSSAAVSGSATAAPAGASKPGKTSTPNSGAKGGKAEDHLQLDTTQITGNQELPKVLYIVPWKRSDLGDLLGKPANSLLDEVLQPVDRDVFKRENRYYDALKPDAAGAAGKATGAAVQGSGDKR
jgi:hypothetical protein